MRIIGFVFRCLFKVIMILNKHKIPYIFFNLFGFAINTFLILSESKFSIILCFFLLTSNFILLFFYDKKQNNGIYIFDIKLLFLVAVFLYGFVPLLEFISVNGILFSNSFSVASLVYLSAFIGFGIGLFYNSTSIDFTNLSFPKINNQIPVILTIILITGFYFLAQKMNMLNIGNSIEDLNRNEILKERNQIWVVLNMIISAHFIFLFLSYYNETNKIKSYILISFILSMFAVYSLIHLSIGNRRELVPIFISFIAIAYAKKFKRINFISILILGCLFVFFTYVGIIRYISNASEIFTLQELLVYALSYNEFAYPFKTIYYTIEHFDKFDLMFGATYFVYPILLAIPRVIFPNKPRGLGSDFVVKVFGEDYGLGFAYTPVTEALINFSYIGPFFIYVLYGLFISKQISNIKNNKNQYQYFILLSMSIDFGRGDFPSLIYSFFIMAVWIKFISYVGKKKYSFR